MAEIIGKKRFVKASLHHELRCSDPPCSTQKRRLWDERGGGGWDGMASKQARINRAGRREGGRTTSENKNVIVLWSSDENRRAYARFQRTKDDFLLVGSRNERAGELRFCRGKQKTLIPVVNDKKARASYDFRQQKIYTVLLVQWL